MIVSFSMLWGTGGRILVLYLGISFRLIAKGIVSGKCGIGPCFLDCGYLLVYLPLAFDISFVLSQVEVYIYKCLLTLFSCPDRFTFVW